MADLYAVMGNPIAHSRSPFIHAAFAEQTGESIVYEPIFVELGGFAAAVDAFRARGGRGLNVTVPFKGDAYAVCATRSARAERAEAVNTLVLGDGGAIHGDNTDGVGLVRDLSANLGIALEGRRILLLGAGGASRGVVGPLLGCRPTELVIANRTHARAEALAAAFAAAGPVAARRLEALDGGRFDLVINATAASIDGDVPTLGPGVLAPGAWCYDMMYAAHPTAFVAWARAHGAGGAVDGLGMLVEQAAESFRIWRRKDPGTGPVIDALRGLLEAGG